VALICDTGPLYAAMDRADADHQTCAELLAGSDEQLIVPAPVIVELDWLASSRLGPEPFAAFLAAVTLTSSGGSDRLGLSDGRHR